MSMNVDEIRNRHFFVSLPLLVLEYVCDLCRFSALFLNLIIRGCRHLILIQIVNTSFNKSDKFTMSEVRGFPTDIDLTKTEISRTALFIAGTIILIRKLLN